MNRRSRGSPNEPPKRGTSDKAAVHAVNLRLSWQLSLAGVQSRSLPFFAGTDAYFLTDRQPRFHIRCGRPGAARHRSTKPHCAFGIAPCMPPADSLPSMPHSGPFGRGAGGLCGSRMREHRAQGTAGFVRCEEQASGYAGIRANRLLFLLRRLACMLLRPILVPVPGEGAKDDCGASSQ